jgi:hypothetical protein
MIVNRFLYHRAHVWRPLFSVTGKALRDAVEIWTTVYGSMALLCCYGIVSLDTLSSHLGWRPATYFGLFMFCLSLVAGNRSRLRGQ